MLFETENRSKRRIPIRPVPLFMTCGNRAGRKSTTFILSENRRPRTAITQSNLTGGSRNHPSIFGSSPSAPRLHISCEVVAPRQAGRQRKCRHRPLRRRSQSACQPTSCRDRRHRRFPAERTRARVSAPGGPATTVDIVVSLVWWNLGPRLSVKARYQMETPPWKISVSGYFQP